MQAILKKYQYWLLFGTVFIVAIILLLIQLFPNKESTVMPPPTAKVKTSMAREVTTASVEHSAMLIDIKGAVRRPGVYRLEGDIRLYDVVEKAGGMTEDADEIKVPLAKKVTDQTTIYIPKKGEGNIKVIQEVGGEITAGNVQERVGDTQEKININTANTSQLQEIEGIGAKRAETIIKYREEHGPFQKLEDLMNISGIGEKTFARLKERITI